MPEGRKEKLMLHVCCAPCSTYSLEKLLEDYDVSCFFYNPNIHPKDEWEKRREEILNYIRNRYPDEEIKIVIGEYDDENWFSLVEGLEGEMEGGERCKVCYKMRLERTEEEALRNGCGLFTTTLTISPHKDSEIINQTGREAAARCGSRVTFLEENFKKKDGFKKSILMSKDAGLYRQDYCGCIYSLHSKAHSFRDRIH